METAFLIIEMAVLVLAGTALAERVGVPPPLLLIVVGVVVSYLPFVPTVHLEPEMVLLGLLPPLLYAAAIETSLVDINTHRLSILLLSVVLVILTTLGVGAVVHWLLPGLGWAGALALGAVVAPPDAVAATAIGRRIGLPRQIVTILEGESLLNDATALVALRSAVVAMAATGALSPSGLVWDFVLAAGGGVLVGIAGFVVVAQVRRHITDPLLDTGVSFVTPFAAYALAERIHASGVLAVVIAGLLLGHKAPLIQTAQSRLIERADWRTIAFLLENAVFLLIGLQASWLVSDVLRSELSLGRVLGLCGATLFAVVALRMAFLLAAHPVLARYGPAANRGVPIRYAVLAGWAGMRGVVTLAAAFVIPSDAPYREVLLVVALAVVAGTLFGQGLTLPWLARRLRVRGPDPAADALARAALLQQASSAGLARLREIEGDDPHGVGEVIRQRLDQRNFAAWELLSTRPGEETPSEVYARSRLEMIAAERAAVLRVRSSGDVPAEVVGEVLRMLDVEESTLDVATDRRARLTAVASVGGDARCPHLAEYAVVEVAPDVVCGRCLDEGTRWVALRQCLVCGHVGCCDSSPRQHASGHYLQTRHPVMQSAEPGETWRWCYDDEVTG